MSIIIAIEGPDGVGKTTQVELLKEKYPEFNFQHFPWYDSPSGNLLKQYLDGKIKYSFEQEIDITSAMYTLNRLEWTKRQFNPEKTYIFDRSIGSNFIHNGAKIYRLYKNRGMDDEFIFKKIKEYIITQRNIEVEYKIPLPNKTIYLDANPEIVIDNIMGRGSNVEINENTDHVKDVLTIHSYICRLLGWNVINCTPSNKFKHPNEINEEIRSIIDQCL